MFRNKFTLESAIKIKPDTVETHKSLQKSAQKNDLKFRSDLKKLKITYRCFFGELSARKTSKQNKL